MTLARAHNRDTVPLMLSINKNYGSFLVLLSQNVYYYYYCYCYYYHWYQLHCFLGDKGNLEINFYHATVRITRVNQQKNHLQTCSRVEIQQGKNIIMFFRSLSSKLKEIGIKLCLTEPFCVWCSKKKSTYSATEFEVTIYEIRFCNSFNITIFNVIIIVHLYS